MFGGGSTLLNKGYLTVEPCDVKRSASWEATHSFNNAVYFLFCFQKKKKWVSPVKARKRQLECSTLCEFTLTILNLNIEVNVWFKCGGVLLLSVFSFSYLCLFLVFLCYYVCYVL